MTDRQSKCNALQKSLGSKVSRPNSTDYTLEQMYWSQQQSSVHPSCRVTPLNTSDVANTLLIIENTGCPFAVKSGGHAAYTGSSNIEQGVTIDLRNLTTLTVSADKRTTSIGTGNRWIDVYDYLQPQNLSVVGGRVAHIGTGGLTLGGGISFFSGRHGWALDSVRAYEVVLPGGRIVTATPTSLSDLYFALRGGGNNFGIVTRIDVETFPQGDMWGGATVYNETEGPAIASAFEDFAVKASNDPDAALFSAFAFAQGKFFYSNFYTYARPQVDPPIFANFTRLPNLTSTARITTMPDLANELNRSNPDGFRETYWAAAFKNSGPLFSEINAIFRNEVANIADARNVIPACVQQPITDAVIEQFSKNGGNALGIVPADGPLNLLNIAISWSDAADDERIMAAARNTVNKATAAAKAKGLDFRYLYQNYAAAEQDVFGSYGAENKQKLLNISRKYDPKRVLQLLQPGYFKIGV